MYEHLVTWAWKKQCMSSPGLPTFLNQINLCVCFWCSLFEQNNKEDKIIQQFACSIGNDKIIYLKYLNSQHTYIHGTFMGFCGLISGRLVVYRNNISFYWRKLNPCPFTYIPFSLCLMIKRKNKKKRIFYGLLHSTNTI